MNGSRVRISEGAIEGSSVGASERPTSVGAMKAGARLGNTDAKSDGSVVGDSETLTTGSSVGASERFTKVGAMNVGA
jgi:hypothetical protein